MKHEVIALAALGPAEIMQELEADYRVHRLWEATDRQAMLSELAERIEVLVTTGVAGADRALMEALPKLRLISVYGVGLDAVDLGAARERNVQVTNTPDVLTGAVADLAVGLILDASRQIAAGDRYIRAGVWGERGFGLGWSLRGRKAGMFGYGRIGQEIARLLRAFEVEILYTKRSPLASDVNDAVFVPDLTELAKQSDMLVVACVGGESTRGMVNREVLQALGPSGLLVNIARGSVVDENALVELLASGELGGAALDVFAAEPSVPSALMASERVVLTPHIGSATYETRYAMGRLVLDNIVAYFAGKPLLTPAPGTV